MLKGMLYLLECCLLPFGIIWQTMGLGSILSILLAMIFSLHIFITMHLLNKLFTDDKKNKIHKVSTNIAVFTVVAAVISIPFAYDCCTIAVSAILYAIIISIVLRDGLVISSFDDSNLEDRLK